VRETGRMSTEGRPKRKGAKAVYYDEGDGTQASESDLYEPSNGEESNGESEEVTVETSSQTNGESATNGDDLSSVPAATSPSSTTIRMFNNISISSIVVPGNETITIPHVGERRLVPVLGDGNCLFRALAIGFYGDPNRHGEVRKEIVQEMRAHEDRYAHFHAEDVSFDEYLAKMSEDTAWGGELEIRAFENLRQCWVVVVQAKRDGGVEIVRKHSNTNVEAADDSASMENRSRVYVLYSGESHYDALAPMAETVDRDRERSTTFVDSMDATMSLAHDESFSISYNGARMRLVPQSVSRDASCLMRSLASLQWNDEKRHGDMRLVLAQTTAFDDGNDAEIAAAINETTRDDDVCIRAFVRIFARPVTVVRVNAHDVVEATERYDVVDQNAAVAARRENQRVFLRASPGDEGDHYDPLFKSVATLLRRRKRADTSLNDSVAAPVKRATGLGLSILDTSVRSWSASPGMSAIDSDMDDDAPITEAEIGDIIAASQRDVDDGLYGEYDEAQERVTGALLARVENEITYGYFEDAAACEDEGDDEGWLDEEDEAESETTVKYKSYFKARPEKGMMKKRRDSASHFAPRAPQNDEETNFLRRAVQGDTFAAKCARLALEKMTCEDVLSGTGREADYVQKAGGRDALFDFMTSKCPMWNGAILGLAPRKITETLTNWMLTRDKVLRTLLHDETAAWSKEGRPVLAKEEVAMQSMKKTIKIARKIVGAREKSVHSISKTLREACPDDFLVPGACYVWVYSSGSGAEKLRPYVGETMQCAGRIGQHLGGVEGAYRRLDQKTVPFAYRTANPLANADIAEKYPRLDQNGEEAEKLKSESRDKGSVTGTLVQFAKKRREVLVENAHFAAITSGVFTEEAQRDIVRAYVDHCANERRQDECLESPNAMDCVRFVGMLKWAREVFDTFALRTLTAHDAGGLNKSIPGEPWRWRQQRSCNRAPWTPEQEQALVDIFETHAERLRTTKVTPTTKSTVRNAMRVRTGRERSFSAMLRQLTLMRVEAEKTPGVEFSRKVIEVFNQTIGADYFSDRWFQMYEALTRYRRKYGHCVVPCSFVSDDFVNAPQQLGPWVHTQRNSFKLAQEKKDAKGAGGRGHFGHYAEGSERVNLLNELGFVWDAKEAAWREGYEQLKLYLKDNKHVMVPRRFVTKDNFKLGVWVDNQRHDFKAAQKKKDAKGAGGRGHFGHYAEGSERVNLLNELGFVWDAKEAAWREGYEQLKLYLEENKHIMVPQGFVTKDNFTLGRWVLNQRGEFKAAQKKKDAKGAGGQGHFGHYAEGSERVNLLNELGFVWDAKEAAWQEGYVQLKLYLEDNKHVMVPQRFVAKDNFKLGRWVLNQRNRFKLAQKKKDAKGAGGQGHYAEGSERVNLLNELGFVWNVR